MDKEFDACTGCGQGALKVGAADGLVTVVYANDDSQQKCITQGDKPMDMAWESVTTTDGVDWTANARIVHTPPSFDRPTACVHDGAAGTGTSARRIERGLGEFDFVVGPDGNAYVAVNDSFHTIRLYTSQTRGVKIPQLGIPSDSPWREFCPAALPAPFASVQWAPLGVPCSSPLIDAASFGGSNPAGNQVWRPTLTADANSRLVLTFTLFQPDLPGADGTISFHYTGDVWPRNGVRATPISLVSNRWQNPTSPPSTPILSFSAGLLYSLNPSTTRLGLYNSAVVAGLFPPPQPPLAPATPSDSPLGCGVDRLFVPLWPSIAPRQSMFEQVIDSTYVLLTP